MKKTSNNKSNKVKKTIWIFLFSALFTQYSCYENKEGCLDYLAVNYTPSADVECENCCEYPPLRLKLEHVYKGKKLIFGDTLENDLSLFYLIEQKFYISEVDVFAHSTMLPFIKRSTYVFPTGEERLYNKTKIVEKNAPNIDINTVRTVEVPDSVSLTLGIPDKFNELNKKVLETDSPFLTTNGLYDTTRVEYITYYLKFIGGPSLKDTMSINLYEDTTFHKSFGGITVIKGSPIEIPLVLDYDVLFKNINFNSNKLLIEEGLRKNLSQFIR